MDEAIRIPGTRITFGIDVILGLLPFVGDFAGMACGLPLIVAAVRRRLPVVVILAMLVNVLVDAIVGSFPILGDLFDLFWKSHRKNLQLLKNPGSLGLVAREAWWKLSGLLGVLVLLLVLGAFLLVQTVSLYARFFATW